MKILVIGMCGNSLFYNKESKKLMKEEPGGKGYNQAVGIAKLGATVAFIGAIGNDESGRLCSKVLDDEKVQNFLIVKEESSTYATINVDMHGNNEICVKFGSKLDLNDLDYIREKIDQFDIILLQNEIMKELNIEIIKYARKTNKIIIMNPAPVAIWMKDYLEYFDILTPNEEEARALFNIDDNIESTNLGTFILNKTNKCVLVTIGSKGSLLVNNESVKHFEAKKVISVDTTGAGDLMNACIAYGISKHMPLDDIIALGTKACAYSVQRHYVLDSYPKIQNLE